MSREDVARSVVQYLQAEGIEDEVQVCFFNLSD